MPKTMEKINKKVLFTFPLFLILSLFISHYIKKEKMVSKITELPVESLNHGCTRMSIDPKFETTQPYDFKYIEETVYDLAKSEDSLGHSVREALEVIETAYKKYG
jgi:hypothetical protein